MPLIGPAAITAAGARHTRARGRRGNSLIGSHYRGTARYVSPSGKATFTIGGTNITDKRYITTGQPQFAGGVVFGTYNAPREWYATFGVKM